MIERILLIMKGNLKDVMKKFLSKNYECKQIGIFVLQYNLCSVIEWLGKKRKMGVNDLSDRGKSERSFICIF